MKIKAASQSHQMFEKGQKKERNWMTARRKIEEAQATRTVLGKK